MVDDKSEKDDAPSVGSSCRVWHGPGFTREGRIIDINRQDREVLVRYIYDIPDEWVRWSKLC